MFGKAFRDSAQSSGLQTFGQTIFLTVKRRAWSFGGPGLILILLQAMAFPMGGVLALGEEPDQQRLEYFEKHVRPLLVDHCFECHDKKNGPDNGSLVLETVEGIVAGGSRGRLFDPADPEGSLLLQAVQFEEDDLQMPPSGKMSEEQIKVIRKWLEDGAILPKPSKDRRPYLKMRRASAWPLDTGLQRLDFELPRGFENWPER